MCDHVIQSWDNMMIEQQTKLRFDGSAWCNLDIALRNIDQIFRQRVQATGLSVIEWYILRALYAEDGQHASQLATEVGRAATSFTPNLDKLQDKGFIHRRPDPYDRRAVRIYLTDKAKLHRAEILNLAHDLDNWIRSYFNEDELEYFHSVLQVLQIIEQD